MSDNEGLLFFLMALFAVLVVGIVILMIIFGIIFPLPYTKRKTRTTSCRTGTLEIKIWKESNANLAFPYSDALSEIEDAVREGAMGGRLDLHVPESTTPRLLKHDYLTNRFLVDWNIVES